MWWRQLELLDPANAKHSFHYFAGADRGGKFVGISKKTWVDAYMKLDGHDLIINCFRELSHIPTLLVNEELPQQVMVLVVFAMFTFNPAGVTSDSYCLIIPFCSCKYIAMCDTSYLSKCPILPPIDQNGWFLEEGNYIPIRCLTRPALNAAMELNKCGWKWGCKGRCTHHRNNLGYTSLCKCSIDECGNGILPGTAILWKEMYVQAETYVTQLILLLMTSSVFTQMMMMMMTTIFFQNQGTLCLACFYLVTLCLGFWYFYFGPHRTTI